MTANPKLALDQKNLGKQGAFIDDTTDFLHAAIVSGEPAITSELI